MAHTKAEIDAMEEAGELYVCPSCDYHGHADEFGSTCPRCGETLSDHEPDED